MSEIAELWAELSHRSKSFKSAFDLSAAFAVDPQRPVAFTLTAPRIAADLSRNLWDGALLERLLALAEARGLPALRAAMWAGEPINRTEGRAVTHVRLREPGAAAPLLDMAERIRADARFTHLVHLGVGGSSLGPELCVQALLDCADSPVEVRVVANVDGHDLQRALRGLEPARTLFVVASKSWSTLETLRNADKARAWLAQDPQACWAEQAVAVTAAPDKARAAGYRHVLTMPDSVGGRFSVWSAVGLPLAVALGREGFEAFLHGAAEMDAHFRDIPLRDNLPVLLGLLDVWNSSFLGFASRCVVPYHHGLRRLPAWLQQLEMESNGKRVDVNGQPVPFATSPAVWGEEGSDSQHAFFQWLHQGTQRVPVEFVLVARARHPWPDHHRWLLASALAQAKCLMEGGRAGPGQRAGHEDFPGNRPSSFLVLEDLSPRSLGALLALYEHRCFVAGAVWGINSFDQWGVELGKRLAKAIEPALAPGDAEGIDPVTANTLQLLLRMQG